MGQAKAILSNITQNKGLNTIKRVIYSGNGRAFAISEPGEHASPEVILARYARQSWRFSCADQVKLLIDGGETFPEMLQAIESSAQSILLETFILRDDSTGRKFLSALAKAAKRGVHVRVLYDYVGSRFISPQFVNQMLDAGIDVAVFHPLVLYRPSWAVNRRDHRKIMVVDGYISFTGGINIADDYASKAEGGMGWRDTHIRIDGESTAEAFEEIFEYSWRRATPYDLTLTRGAVLKQGLKNTFKRRRRVKVSQEPRKGCPAGHPAVHVAANREFKQRRLIHNSYLYAINRAQHYILIENAYFIPDSDVRNALARAVKRGVTVAVVLARKSDAQVVAMASRHVYKDLLEIGVRIYELPDRMMHAKTAVIDDGWAIVGSYNFDHRSLFHNLEIAAVVIDNNFAVQLKEQTLKDISQCHEITDQSHNARPLCSKLLEPAAHFFRKWL